MIRFFNKNKGQDILSPVSGRLIPLSDVNDEAFANGYLGDGFCVVPDDGCFVAPISGKIEVAFPTGHAYGIKNDNLELMVHIGIDTVQLNGYGFESKVKQGQMVHAGDPLAVVDLNAVREKGYDLATVVIYTDGKSNASVDYKDHVEAGAPVAKVMLK